jgi:poly-gamma-glutamate synthesis protein (capsule biosynthesis protein)
VRSARRAADVVVVYLHWGTDYTECPDAAQRRTARALAAAGADVVVGGHAHRVQGAGWLGRSYVAYGLGNFIWYRNQPAANGTSGVLTLTLDGRRVVGRRWTPLRIGPDGLPARPGGATAAGMLRNWHAARGCTGLQDRPPAR